jgi:cephalosporin hydroxylase
MNSEYEFTVDWFSQHWKNWLILTEDQKISKVLEIGSFEGRSACTMIEHFSKTAPLEVFCIDHWGGSADLKDFDMKKVEQRFDRNIQRAITGPTHPVRVQKHRGKSIEILSSLLVNGYREYFDIVFVDGSHLASDVLSDLVLSYELCAIGGLIICDDYLWSDVPHGSEDLLALPRLAIDAFGRIFTRKGRIMGWPAALPGILSEDGLTIQPCSPPAAIPRKDL